MKFSVLSISVVLLFLFMPVHGTSQENNEFARPVKTVAGFTDFYLGVDNAEPYISINPRDPKNIICAFNYGCYYTLDGVTWRKNQTIYPGFDPFLTFDSIGRAFYASLTSSLLYTLGKSTDKGQTWIMSSPVTNIADKECICANRHGGIFNNYLYSGWQRFYSGQYQDDIYFSYSTNQGEYWNTKLLGANMGLCPYITIGPSLYGPGEIIYFGYNYHVSGSAYEVKMLVSSNSGISFSQGITVAALTSPPALKNDSLKINSCIYMDADNSGGPYRGNVYIVYCARGQGTDESDIMFTKSTNYGFNWSVPLRLNDDSTSSDQYMPAICVDNSGLIYAVWYDSRVDPVNNRMTMLYGTVSSNGGATFCPDYPVSTESFNPNLIALNGYVGHYISVASSNHSAIAAWTDGRRNTFGSYAGYLMDFALAVNPEVNVMNSNDTAFFSVGIPRVKGPFNSRVNITAVLDSIPQQGNVFVNFVNGKDYITSFPDSVKIRVITSGIPSSRVFKLNITARSIYDTPVHLQTVSIPVNYLYSTNMFCRESNKPIADICDISDTITIVQAGLVQDLKVQLNINHTNDGHLAVFLKKSPFNVQLTQYNGTGGQNFTNTVFDDTAALSIKQGTPPFTGHYRPDVALTYFNGTPLNTDWVLNIRDFTSGSTGMLLNWCLFTKFLSPISVNNNLTELPGEFKIERIYPNPFNTTTTLQFSVPSFLRSSSLQGTEGVNLAIYDILGREITVLVNEKLAPGIYRIAWNASAFSSGIYFCVLKANSFMQTKRMVLIK